MADFFEGQSLLCVLTHQHGRDLKTPVFHDVVVTQVGRKYVTLSNNYKMIVENMLLDGKGYTSPGQCYLDQAHYERTTGRKIAWTQLGRDVMNGYAPEGVTFADIQAARKLLGLATDNE